MQFLQAGCSSWCTEGNMSLSVNAAMFLQERGDCLLSFWFHWVHRWLYPSLWRVASLPPWLFQTAECCRCSLASTHWVQKAELARMPSYIPSSVIFRYYFSIYSYFSVFVSFDLPYWQPVSFGAYFYAFTKFVTVCMVSTTTVKRL